MTFTAPGIRRPGPYTACYACGARRKDHVGDALACPPSTGRPPVDLDEDRPA